MKKEDAMASMQAMKAFAAANLSVLCAEICEWQATSVLRDGKLREMSKLCTFDPPRRLQHAERMVERAAMERLASQPQAPAAAVPEWMKLVPTEPTPEIIAAAAVAVWPTASPSDVAMARVAAQAVLMEMDTAPGVTIDVLAGILATMAPAYRAMVAAAPAPEVSDGRG